MPEKLVLTYPGGLDTSVMVHWIKEKYGYDVGRSSFLSLYDTALATYDASSTFDQTRSDGFIDAWAMATVVANARKREHSTRQSQYGVAPKATAQARKSK